MSLVYLKNKQNGVTYVYESTGYWYKGKKQARNIRKCIGKLDPVRGEYIPSKRLQEEPAMVGKPGPVPAVECRHLFYGATCLFNAIGEKIGVSEDLKECFPHAYKKILFIAYYLVLEDRNPMSRFSKWAKTHYRPYGKEIPSQRSGELFGSIDEEGKQRFFLLQGQRRVGK